MKKLIAMIVMLFLAVAIVGCDGKKSSPAGTGTQPSGTTPKP